MTNTDELINDFFKESQFVLSGESVNNDLLKEEKIIPDNNIAENKTETKIELKDQLKIDNKKTGNKLWGFKGIAGMENLKKEFRDNLILPLKNKELFEKYKVGIPNGILLYGPPGCGKTFIVTKLSEELGLPLIKHSMAEIGSTYQHETTINIKKIFDEVKGKAPCILFLDEIDSLTGKRDSQTTDAKSEELAQFLQEFNNISSFDIIVIGATNRPDEIDSAIMRTGRFDNHFYVGPPDIEARKELFKLYTQKIGRPVGKIDYEKIAILTNDYTSSDIETICDKVARDLAAKSLGKKTISLINTKNITEVIKNTHSSLLNVDMSIFYSFQK